jgi:fucose permease
VSALILVALSYSSLLSLALLDNARGPFYPDILTELGVDATRGSLFFAVVSLFAFLGSWRSHGWLHRLGSVRLVVWGSFLLSLGFFAIARAPRLPLMLVFCAVFGLAYGVLNLAQNVLIYQAASGEKRRRLYSGLHAMYGLASLAAPLAASACRSFGLDWRSSFALLAAAPLVVGAGGLVCREGRSGPAAPLASTGQGRAPRPAALDRGEWVICGLFALMLAAYLWGEISISTRLALWLRQERGFTPERADLYLAGFFLALLSGRVIFGSLGFKRFGNIAVLSLSAGAGAFFYAGALSVDPRLFFICGLTMSPFYPVAMDQVSAYFGGKSSQALGFVIGSGSLSVVLMHMTVGRLNDAVGLTEALGVCAAVLALLTMALLCSYHVRAKGVRRHD